MSRVVEYAFFFGLLALAGYMVWQIVAPFVSALALAAIIVTICYPLYERLRRVVPRNNRTIAAFLSTLVVLLVIVLPVVFLSSLVAREVVTFYQSLDPSNGGLSITEQLTELEGMIQVYIPEFNIDLAEQLKATGQWITGNLGAIFAGTVSTIFVFFIAVLGSFYFFRDGQELLQLVIKASPLPDHEDKIIFRRLAQAVRAVATGTLLVAIIQGSLAAFGFWLVGFDRFILWGSLASIGALMPGVGTGIVNFPAVAYLFFTGEIAWGFVLLVWSIAVVGLIDNLVGPYLMGRGNNMHPFIILIAVLGGISLMGPVGFIIGPVVVTLFLVLLEIYNQYIVYEKRPHELSDEETV